MAKTAEIPRAQIGYIADQPGDMVAARKAEVVPIGAAWAAGSSAAAIRAAGAAIVALQPHDLLQLAAQSSHLHRQPLHASSDG
jgi:phosphoglycolate phosphatase-like HAD superfamily hydrolase